MRDLGPVWWVIIGAVVTMRLCAFGAGIWCVIQEEWRLYAIALLTAVTLPNFEQLLMEW